MKNKYLYIILAWLLIEFSSQATNKTYNHTTIPNNIICSAGDVVTLSSGTYKDKAIIVGGYGTADNPIVVQAQLAGGVKFTGTSNLKIYGTYIIVKGMYYETVSSNPIIEFIGSKTTENCRVTNTSIIDSNTDTDSEEVNWVSIYGKNNRVDHCHFQNKRNMGTLLIVWLTPETPAFHRIDANYFTRPLTYSNGDNGQEVLRIGDSSTSMTDAYCVVENNVFEECNGEIETISNKSCKNMYYNNVFTNCEGTLTLRHGKNCIVDGNYFLGNSSNSDNGGLRLIDSGHKAYNNYFQNIGGNGFRSALCLLNGVTNSLENGYFPASNCIAAFNTFVNCKQAINMGYNDGGDNTVVCENSELANNVVYNTSSTSNIKITTAGTGNTYNNNILYNVNSIPFNSNEYYVANPLFKVITDSYSLYEPESTSPLATTYSTNTIDDVTTDIKGRNRELVKHPGCFQISNEEAKPIPTKQNIGVSWINKENNETILDFENTLYYQDVDMEENINEANSITYQANTFILKDAITNGQIIVYSTSGVRLLDKTFEGYTVTGNLSKGVYIVKVLADGKTNITQKLIIYN